MKELLIKQYLEMRKNEALWYKAAVQYEHEGRSGLSHLAMCRHEVWNKAANMVEFVLESENK